MTFTLCYHLNVRFFLALALVASTAAAAPQVEIRAQAQVALESVKLTAEGEVEVKGQLIDRFTGEAISNKRVTVRIGRSSGNDTTENNGSFTVELHDVDSGPQRIELEFPGDRQTDRAQFVTTTDPSRATVKLSIGQEDTPEGAKIVVRAENDDHAAMKLPVQLLVGPPGDDSQLRPIARVETGSFYNLKRAAVGGAGPKRIRATFAGDTTTQAATVDATIELTTASTTTMTADKTNLAYEDDLVVTGTVTDNDTKPLPRVAVTLTSGDRRLANVVTNDDGGYRFKVEAEILGQGQFGIQVQSDPGKSYIKPSRSPPAIIKVAPPQPVPVSYTVAAFIATVFAAGGFFTARAKPWKRFAKRVPPAEEKRETTDDDGIAGGLVVAKPGIVSTLRRPNDDGFAGAVRESVRGRPVAQAVVRLLLGDVERETRTAGDGSFALEKLTPGDWQAEVAAPGHVTERFGVTIPHRGELRGVRVDLVPVRERVFQLYRRAAEPALPEPRLWGIWSPRQIVDHVRGKQPTPALSELTDFVEEIYFGPRLAAETVLPQCAERVDRAIRERL